MPKFTLKRMILATACLAAAFAAYGMLARSYDAQVERFPSLADPQVVVVGLLVCVMPAVAVGLLWNRTDLAVIVFVSLLLIALLLPAMQPAAPPAGGAAPPIQFRDPIKGVYPSDAARDNRASPPIQSSP
jgi:hypothetical protein